MTTNRGPLVAMVRGVMIYSTRSSVPTGRSYGRAPEGSESLPLSVGQRGA